jgi:hypothetical protein
MLLVLTLRVFSRRRKAVIYLEFNSYGGREHFSNFIYYCYTYCIKINLTHINCIM